MTSRIMAALLALTGGLLPLGFAMSSQYEQDYRSGTLNIAHTLAAAAEEKTADHGDSAVLTRTLAALRRENEGGPELAVAVVDDNGQVVVGQDTGLYTAARAASGLAGTSKVTHVGDRLLVVVPVNGHAEKVTGAVLLSRSMATLDDRVMRLWAGLGTVAFLAVVAAVVLALTLAHWVGRPLGRLEAAAEALGAGELGARTEPPKRPSEIRRLAERFNVMAARLENLIYDHRTVLADVSHQLRTPLSALRLRMELLAEEATSDPAEFDAALDELARLARLVDGLLAVARAEHATASPEPVQVTGLLTERAEAWRPIAAERDVQLSVEAHDHLTALAAPGNLEQVIDNLVDNALTAAPQGGHVRLAVRRSGHRTRVTVADDGPGMTAETMEDAFRRFRTGRTAGTGLGLAIVHRLVTADGGEVSLSDTRGGGLTVTLDLPAER